MKKREFCFQPQTNLGKMIQLGIVIVLSFQLTAKPAA
jgi:hypothetical protein